MMKQFGVTAKGTPEKILFDSLQSSFIPLFSSEAANRSILILFNVLYLILVEVLKGQRLQRIQVPENLNLHLVHSFNFLQYYKEQLLNFSSTLKRYHLISSKQSRVVFLV